MPVPQIVGEETFAQVQAKLDANQQGALRNTRHEYLLRALVSCGACRLACTGRQTGAGYRYYLCRGRTDALRAAQGRRCTARYIPAGQLDELVWADLCALLTDPGQVAHALARAQGGARLPQELQARQATIGQALGRLERQQQRLLDAYLAEVLGLPELQRKRQELDRRHATLLAQQRQLDAAAGQRLELQAVADGIEGFCQAIRAGLATATFEQQRQLAELLIDRVIVTDDQVEIRYVLPASPDGPHHPFCQLRKDHLDELPVMLGALGTAVAWSGDFAAASALIVEADAVCEVTGSRAAPFTAMMLASLRGRRAEAAPLIEATIAEAEAGGQGIAVAYAHWTAAILANGLGRYDEGLTAARQASEDTFALHISMWALPELVEAAACSGNTDLAIGAAERLAEFTQAGGTDFGLGLEARSRALVSQGPAAEGWYRDAIDRLGRTQLRPELARAHLLYGEWLYREKRRGEARVQLRTAHDMLDAMGMEAFAERARRGLRAAGETVQARAVEAVSALTAQEASIARLAMEGRTNAEIGALLFLSGRTVEWHLRRVFTKLGISSRRELTAALKQAGLSG